VKFKVGDVLVNSITGTVVTVKSIDLSRGVENQLEVVFHESGNIRHGYFTVDGRIPFYKDQKPRLRKLTKLELALQ
jgi:3-oxoacyl-ACP reductase-like protein